MLKTFSLTDVGRIRQLNQDYVYTSEEPVGILPNLFIVADGMGGHRAGDYASRTTVESIVHEIKKSMQGTVEEVLTSAIRVTNHKILQESDQEEKYKGMGTTLVLATCSEQVLTVANIGDSRLYVIGKEIRQITRDHSLVEEMVLAGGIDPREARMHPDKNMITRAIGAMDDIQADFFTVLLEPDDMILMCSDGLTNMIEDRDIQMIVRREIDLVGMAESLVRAANESGGADNIAVVLIKPDVVASYDK